MKTYENGLSSQSRFPVSRTPKALMFALRWIVHATQYQATRCLIFRPKPSDNQDLKAFTRLTSVGGQRTRPSIYLGQSPKVSPLVDRSTSPGLLRKRDWIVGGARRRLPFPPPPFPPRVPLLAHGRVTAHCGRPMLLRGRNAIAGHQLPSGRLGPRPHCTTHSFVQDRRAALGSRHTQR